MEPLAVFQQLAISTLLGLLVGLQRERTESNLAGIRTFPLITLFGTLCALLSSQSGQVWVLPAGLLALVALILVGNFPKLRQAEPDPGVTTEMAMLVMFADGAVVAFGTHMWIVAAAVAGTVAMLLHLKPQMHGLAARMGDADFRAIMQFVLITFIILPVLPNKGYDPFDPFRPLLPPDFGEFPVLNPYEVWLMVVLVVGISLGGYVIYKLFGRQAGIVLGGIVGGTISSTATTVSYARRTVTAPEACGLAAIVIMIASTITFIRVLLEIAVAAPSLLPVAFWPIVALMSVAAALAAVAWMAHGRQENDMPEQENPTELKSAIVFAVVYAIVLVGVAVGKHYLENEGLYVIAAISGMTDMDAITLSSSRLVQSGQLDAQIAWRLILIGSLSNIVFKGLIVAAMGHRRLLAQISGLFGVTLVAGIAILVWWP
ncbi:MAG: MgtC/SapB family protein [Planctomycetes bacterium]|nr:MgtC/SapB family protein [Planctomycetota bacterium]